MSNNYGIGTVDKFAFASANNGTSVATLTGSGNTDSDTYNCPGNSDGSTKAYIHNRGGDSGTEKVVFASDSDSVISNIFTTTHITASTASFQSTTHGYTAGGDSHQNIQKFAFSVEGSPSSVGTIHDGLQKYAGGSQN